MRIHQTNDPHSEYKLFEYKEITSISIKKENLDAKMTIQPRWSFQFTISTSRRAYILYSPSIDERNLWVHTFNWIIYNNLYNLNKTLIISP
jgi:hypothetical protein